MGMVAGSRVVLTHSIGSSNERSDVTLTPHDWMNAQ